MKNVIKKISKVVQMVLLAPIKLPNKALNIIRYVALGLGIVDQVLEEEERSKKDQDGEIEEKEESSHGKP